MTTLQTQTGWELLHEVRLRGMLRTLDDDAGAEELIASGHLARRGPALVITPHGRALHAEWARLPAGSEQETAARQAYERFLDFDKQVKQLTVDWQLASASAPADGYSA